MRRLISSGSSFEAAAGYSRAVVDGEWIFVAGTTGFDYAAMTIADDPVEQARQALRNIAAALAEAGASLADVVRVKYYLSDAADWPQVVPAGRGIRRNPPGRDGADLQPDRPADEDRDRSDGAASAAHAPSPPSPASGGGRGGGLPPSGGPMRRRELVLLPGAMLLLPRTPRAEQRERIRRIGYLTGANGSPEDELGVRETRALVEGLRELGWFDGRNIAIEHRFSGTGRARIVATAKELVAIKPDVIVTVGGATTAAVAAETKTIPVVFTVVGDPVGSGIVTNLARPGGNVTGFGSQEAPLGGKWLQLLKEIAPSVTRVLVIMQADLAQNQVMHDAVVAASPSMGITVATAAVHDLGEVTPAVEAFARTAGGGLVVLTNPIMGSDPRVYFAAAAQNHLPAIYSYPIFAQTGGLISYGTDPVEQFRGAAGYVDKILHGEKPGDLPVQQPTKFHLAVNLKTAKALELTVPQSLLARADEVIE